MAEDSVATLRGTVLLISDDAETRATTAAALRQEGHGILEAGSLEQAEPYLQSGDAEVVVADIQARTAEFYDVLRMALAKVPPVPVVVLTQYSTVDDAVESVKQGALDYVVKPVDAKDIQTCVHQGLERRQMLAGTGLRVEEITGFGGLLGVSDAIEDVINQIRLVAPYKSTVLIMGESGTGKELVARAIHAISAYASGPFLAVNCSALPRDLVESQLFGHEKGAFTGASSSHKGLFEAATGGTLFLDEIGDLAMEAQAKLLRTIEDRHVTRVGDTRPVPVNVRLLAATNADLGVRMREERFRDDLYYRLNVLNVLVPPLRERPEDIRTLLRVFLDRFADENGLPPKEVTPKALSCLEAYHWPGNVRELKNTVERLVVYATSGVIDVDDLPADLRVHAPAGGDATRSSIPYTGLTLAEIEEAAIRNTLEHTRGNRTQAARILRISLRTLQRKLKEYRYHAPDPSDLPPS